jgi:hypothetical protein
MSSLGEWAQIRLAFLCRPDAVAALILPYTAGRMDRNRHPGTKSTRQYVRYLNAIGGLADVPQSSAHRPGWPTGDIIP